MTELNDMFVGLGDSTEDSWDQIERARGPAYLQHEKEAFAAAVMEHKEAISDPFIGLGATPKTATDPLEL
ncbi:MAG: hypothetical protein M1826_004577 [Phylliscum demangeonii]|nr:MAG: hypothetical protein M1826_004577 [Phylliscum demangeonii]